MSRWKHLCGSSQKKGMNLYKAKGDETLPYLNATCDLLYSLGVTANYKGFLHTTYAVPLCMERQDRLLLVTKWLYPDVARRYGTNWKAVERNIRTVSRIAWIRNRVLLESLAQRPLDRHLCSTEFLAVLFHAVYSAEFQDLSSSKS